MPTMKQVVLAAHPRAVPRTSDFRVEEVDVPTPGDGEFLSRALWLSVDPFMRLGLDAEPMGNPVAPGELMRGSTVSEVIESRHPGFQVGDLVEGRTGWREYAVSDGGGLRRIDKTTAPASAALGVLGMTGVTAHAGMIEVGRAKAGDTVVISAAGGAVGSVAGQIGKILGCHVVGIAGGAEKCRKVMELGFDACLDYRAADYPAALAAACPKGINLYFENVGGAVTDAVIPLFAPGGRMAMCGTIAYYQLGHEQKSSEPDRMPLLMRTMMARALTLQGFSGAHAAGPEAMPHLAQWLAEGKLRFPQTVYEGLGEAPKAFVSLFTPNDNIGKVVVRVASDAQ